MTLICVVSSILQHILVQLNFLVQKSIFITTMTYAKTTFEISILSSYRRNVGIFSIFHVILMEFPIEKNIWHSHVMGNHI